MTKQSVYKRWKEGMANLTPLQHAKAQKEGLLWSVWGIALASVVMMYRGMWYWAVFLGAFIWLQAWSYLKAKQTYEGLKQMVEDKNV